VIRKRVALEPLISADSSSRAQGSTSGAGHSHEDTTSPSEGPRVDRRTTLARGIRSSRPAKRSVEQLAIVVLEQRRSQPGDRARGFQRGLHPELDEVGSKLQSQERISPAALRVLRAYEPRPDPSQAAPPVHAASAVSNQPDRVIAQVIGDAVSKILIIERDKLNLNRRNLGDRRASSIWPTVTLHSRSLDGRRVGAASAGRSSRGGLGVDGVN